MTTSSMRSSSADMTAPDVVTVIVRAGGETLLGDAGAGLAARSRPSGPCGHPYTPRLPRRPPVRQEPADIIRRRASALGFPRVRIAAASPPPGVARYDAFLAAGRHGQMQWMERGRDARADPRRLLPGVRSAVVLGIDHAWPRPPDPGGLTGRVAAYAWGRDYHNLVAKRLRKLVRQLRDDLPGVGFYWAVDSRPVIERAWAERAGLGFIGRNCCLILPGTGSFLFLAVLLVDIELPPDPPLPGADRHCGACRRCLDACPTDAFVGSHQLDARRCISYLTIEHRGPIPEPLRPGIGRWVFGCDLCQEVCPHNHHPPRSPHPDFAPRPGRAWLDLDAVLRTDDADLERALVGSPLRRPGAVGLKRNAAIVLGNLGDPAAEPALLHARSHPDPVVVDAASWALDRLAPGATRQG
ncbi:MAG: tRNA epoxyqueuosine(34) reductase QueG [Deltaproteobacteria bacterium]|nr:MAG: tRNA epoxyqueuosine(34) reductase QueG [Deltaproteobacteria bacterium]